MDTQSTEVGIVGAGFAGLAAALTLRLHRHGVVVFDGGPARNAWAARVNDYLGVPNHSGAELRQIACDQVRAVDGQIVAARIRSVRRQSGGFLLESDDGRCWQAERLLLATGVRDIYPDIRNFFDFYGRSVFVCPHCDGYEVRDQPVAIVSWSAAALPFARTLRQWTTQITVVTDGRSPDLSAEERAELAHLGIATLTQTVRRFEGADGRLTGLRFVDGSRLPIRAAFFNIAAEFRTDLARLLGCQLRPAGCVAADEQQRTSVEHVWVAGDLAGKEQLVAIAAAQGVTAGVDIYRTLPQRVRR